MYTYLLLNAITLLFPVILAFDTKVAYYRKWPHALAAMVPVAICFLAWDHWFTKAGIWHFNNDYLVGLAWLQLPLEEWMFFFTVPFACLFIYEVVINYGQKNLAPHVGRQMATFFGSLLVLIGILVPDQLYTTVTFNLAGGLLLFNGLILKPGYLTSFFITYIIHLIPFALVNGILTAYPVVIYNNAENFGLRLGTIPLEDTIYSLLLLLGNVNLYEFFKKRIEIEA